MGLKKNLKSVANLLLESGETLAMAESCTGGLLSTEVTEVSGASRYFLGSVVSYANSAKQKILKVPGKTLKKPGAVSEVVALMMARGAIKIFSSDWAIGITGIAGPTGGSKLKPVGLVYFSVVGPRVETVERKVFSGNRKQIQQKAAASAVELLLLKLKGE